MPHGPAEEEPGEVDARDRAAHVAGAACRAPVARERCDEGPTGKVLKREITVPPPPVRS
ncbi:hypothetical protein [Streptomyces anandii]|uniref:Uncharacterized protein n=1 Tax=Streptomyces anandii TaxID=285454 RepID=A0ABW6H4V9_9ACTN